MKQIEKGMYVRTKNGIAKYLGVGIDVLKDDGSRSYNHWKSKHIFDNNIFDEEWGDTLTTIDNIDKIIVGKPSFNSIDLIEVGDYVNRELVEDITGEYLRVNGQSHNKHYFSKQIKSIVTHEQFESVSYKIGE